MVWPSSIRAFFYLLPAFFYLLPTFSGAMYLCILSLVFLFLLQVKVPPLTTGGTLVEEMIATPSNVSLVMEEEPPNGGVSEEVGQQMQDVQPILPSIPLVAQGPKVSQPPVPQDP